METLQTYWLEPDELDDMAWQRASRPDYLRLTGRGFLGLRIQQVADPRWLDWTTAMEEAE